MGTQEGRLTGTAPSAGTARGAAKEITQQGQTPAKGLDAPTKVVISVENARGRFFEGIRLVPKDAASSHGGGGIVRFLSRDRGPGVG